MVITFLGPLKIRMFAARNTFSKIGSLKSNSRRTIPPSDPILLQFLKAFQVNIYLIATTKTYLWGKPFHVATYMRLRRYLILFSSFAAKIKRKHVIFQQTFSERRTSAFDDERIKSAAHRIS